MTPMKRNYRVLVQKKSGKGMRAAVWKGRRAFTQKEAEIVFNILLKKGRLCRVQKIIPVKNANDKLIKKWLTGDLDFDRKLMVKLAKVARDSKTKIHVNYGRRTYQEQLYLWNKYGPPRAAKPGTSRHETGLAADCVTSRLKKNVGDVKRIRVAMKRHGLCLPVPNEPWHVEAGTRWNA